MFRQLIQLQGRLAAAIERSEAMFGATHLRDPASLKAAQRELIEALTEYQQFKRMQIFAPFSEREGYRARQARRLCSYCIEASEAFRRHVLDWGAASSAERWHDLRPAALQAIAGFRARLERERAEIALLLEEKIAA